MKPILSVLVVLLLVAFAIVVVPSEGPSSGAEPIAYGKDTCARCRMHLSRPGFAGELRDRAGALSKYDDLGCMLVAMWSMHAEVPGAWVEDYERHDLVPLLQAAFVTDSTQQTPMGFGILGFRSAESARHYTEQHGGQVVTLEDLLKDKNRFQREPPGDHAHGD